MGATVLQLLVLLTDLQQHTDRPPRWQITHGPPDHLLELPHQGPNIQTPSPIGHTVDDMVDHWDALAY